MALPKTNIVFNVYKIINTDWKKNYDTSPEYIDVDWYIYTPEYFKANGFFEVDWTVWEYRLLTEQTDILENDELKNVITNKVYKVLKSDIKESNWVRPTFYEIILTSVI